MNNEGYFLIKAIRRDLLCVFCLKLISWVKAKMAFFEKNY